MSELREIVERHRERLMAIEGVVGVAVGLSASDPDKRCVIVYATGAVRPASIPATLEGRDVEVHGTSGFRAG